MGDFDGLKELIERVDDEERAMRKKLLEVQEREVVEKRKKRKFEEKRAILAEVESRMRVDKDVTWDTAYEQAKARWDDDSD